MPSTVIPAEKGSIFIGRTNRLESISSHWMERLRSLVDYDNKTFGPIYDLTSKHLKIREVTLESNPQSYVGRERLAAVFLHCQNETGEKIDPMTNEVRLGAYSEIFVEMLTSHWSRTFSESEFEIYTVHEIRHVTNPALNFVLGSAGVFEDQRAMYAETLKLIRMFGSVASDKLPVYPL